MHRRVKAGNLTIGILLKMNPAKQASNRQEEVHTVSKRHPKLKEVVLAE